MKHRILLIEPTIQPVGVSFLKERCKVFMAPDGQEDTLIRAINEHLVEGVVTRVEKITRRVVESCPTLRVIQQHGVGMDNIDIAAASEHGVRVQNVPDGNYCSVAEHIIMSVLALSRNLLHADRAVRTGNFQYRETNIPHEVANAVLLIVGLGRIGQDVAKKALALDMRVMGYDPFLTKEQMAAFGVDKANTLEEGLRAADYVTVQLHLTPETRGMFSTEQFAQMKPTAYIINLSRGPVINQKALCAALRDHVIAGAALDVFEQEPPAPDEPLLTLPNIILTPHFGGDTYEAKQRISRKAAESILLALDGQDTNNWQNWSAMSGTGRR